MNLLEHTGRCLCGDIAFVATGEPLWRAHCHCQSCRRNTGSVVATFIGYRPEQIVFEHDRRRFYASSRGVQRGFCARCGTPVSYSSTRWPAELHLYLGLFDQPQLLPPERHVHVAEKIPWLQLDPDLPHHAQTSA